LLLLQSFFFGFLRSLSLFLLLLLFFPFGLHDFFGFVGDDSPELLFELLHFLLFFLYLLLHVLLLDSLVSSFIFSSLNLLFLLVDLLKDLVCLVASEVDDIDELFLLFVKVLP
jgi:hypothetical protein